MSKRYVERKIVQEESIPNIYSEHTLHINAKKILFQLQGATHEECHQVKSLLYICFTLSDSHANITQAAAAADRSS